MLPLGVALGVSLAIRGVSRAQGSDRNGGGLTAAVVNIVPEGLILLVALAAAVSAAARSRGAACWRSS